MAPPLDAPVAAAVSSAARVGSASAMDGPAPLAGCGVLATLGGAANAGNGWKDSGVDDEIDGIGLGVVMGVRLGLVDGGRVAVAELIFAGW